LFGVGRDCGRLSEVLVGDGELLGGQSGQIP
jgi:hypothetical protein